MIIDTLILIFGGFIVFAYKKNQEIRPVRQYEDGGCLAGTVLGTLLMLCQDFAGSSSLSDEAEYLHRGGRVCFSNMIHSDSHPVSISPSKETRQYNIIK